MSYTWSCGLWFLAITAILASHTIMAFGLTNVPLIIFTIIINLIGAPVVMPAAFKADAWDKHNRGGIL